MSLGISKSDFLVSISLLLVSKSDFRVADEQASSSDDLSTLAHPRMASAKVRWLPHSKKERLYKKVSRKMYFPTPLACLIGSGGLFQFKCATDWPRSCLSEKPCEGTHGSIPQAVLLIPVAIAPPAVGRARDRFYWKMAMAQTVTLFFPFVDILSLPIVLNLGLVLAVLIIREGYIDKTDRAECEAITALMTPALIIFFSIALGWASLCTRADVPPGAAKFT